LNFDLVRDHSSDTAGHFVERNLLSVEADRTTANDDTARDYFDP
jgi:hypothetical protein